jgi:hypothetical protein
MAIQHHLYTNIITIIWFGNTETQKKFLLQEMSKSKLVGTISCLPGVLSSNPGGEQQNINKKFVGQVLMVDTNTA